MKPLFFGLSDHLLYGVYHPAAHVAGKNGCVLFCPPIGQEYMRTHWAFKRLANQLAKAGLHVLRFDYSACGDSVGGSELMLVERWVDDVHIAAEELLALSGCQKLSIVGLRFGSSLAVLASAGLKVENLLLWDPVIIGKAYLEQLDLMHRAILIDKDRFLDIRKDILTESKDELIGFSFPSQLRETVQEIDLTRVDVKRVKRCFVLTADEQESHRSFIDHLEGTGCACRLHQLSDTVDWSELSKIEEAYLPGETLGMIKELLTWGEQ